MLTYADINAVSQGLTEEFSFYLVAAANAASGFGRCGAGLVSDRVGTSYVTDGSIRLNVDCWTGAINVMIPLTALTGILTYVWPFARTQASLVLVTVIYGWVVS